MSNSDVLVNACFSVYLKTSMETSLLPSASREFYTLAVSISISLSMSLFAKNTAACMKTIKRILLVHWDKFLLKIII